MSNVTKHILNNGMTVLLKEVHNAPLVSWWVLYRVGSRNERTGTTGISHWVEHMMFKGTEKFPPGYLDKAVNRVGGAWNAQTSLDYTAYFETLPADQIDLALELEADRMLNARFDPEETESERTVIISERQGAENSPLFWLGEEVQAAAFRVHGYHHEIIGDMTDLHTMTRDDLYNHYKRHYVPNNAIAVAVGAFDTNEMLEKIRARYESIPAGELPKLFSRPEPEQNGERRVRVERPGRNTFIQVAYRAPAASDPDYFKMEMVNSILTGASGPGGGVDNKTSRLYRALVETELTVSIDGGLNETVDPFLYTITATVRDGVTPEAVQAALDAELDRMARGDVTEAELARAKKQARALFAYSAERVTTQAFWLAFSESFGGYEWFENYVQTLDAVTLDDVKTAAAKYLQPSQRTVGWFIPTSEGDDDMDEFEEGDDE